MPSAGGLPFEQPAAPPRSCNSCGAELQADQEWCLQCGAGAPGSIGGASRRGPTTVILVLLLLLVAGAAVAGAAALTRGKAAPAVTVKTVAQVPSTVAPTTSAPSTTTPTPSTPGVPGFPTSTPKASVPKIPTTGGAGLPKVSNSVPPLPFFNSAPKKSGSTSKQPKPSANEGAIPNETPIAPSGSTGNGSTGSGTPTTPKPTPILLDTNAASTYDPYNYPASNFGEGALAIDGDAATAWTALVDPAVAPRMAEGLVLDLKASRHLERLELNTTTPGATVEVYGSDGHTLPASITDPAWTQVSTPHVLKKTDKLKLRSSQKAFRFVVVWFTKAPAASVGTAQAPGHVALNELALFPLAP